MKKGFENVDFERFNDNQLIRILEMRKEKMVDILKRGGSIIEGSGSNLYDSILIIVDILNDRGIEVDENF